MTDEQLDEIEKLAEAATPGPWAQEVWQGNDDTGGWAAVGPHQESTDCICESEADRKFCHGEFCEDDRSQNDQEKALEDAAFIRAMREHALPLVKAVREARIERDALQGRDERWVKIAEQYERELDEYRHRMGTLLNQLAKEEADAHQFAKERDQYQAWMLAANDELAKVRKVLSEANELRVELTKERDEARAEVERLRDIVAVNDQRLADVWDTARRVVKGEG